MTTPNPPSGHQRADEWAAEEHAEAVQEGRGCWHCWAIAEGIQEKKRGSVPVSFAPPAGLPNSEVLLPPPAGQPESELQKVAREVLTDLGYVWLGDLSGVEVVPVVRDTPGGPPLRLELAHRVCPQRVPITWDGIADDGSAFLGNIVQTAVKFMEGHACTPHTPSPEHQERVRQWQDTASRAPAPAGEPVDGPGCTPFVPGLLTTFRDIANATSSANAPACMGDDCAGCDDPHCYTFKGDD